MTARLDRVKQEISVKEQLVAICADEVKQTKNRLEQTNGIIKAMVSKREELQRNMLLVGCYYKQPIFRSFYI